MRMAADRRDPPNNRRWLRNRARHFRQGMWIRNRMGPRLGDNDNLEG